MSTFDIPKSGTLEQRNGWVVRARVTVIYTPVCG
jgi:hypothetical protein